MTTDYFSLRIGTLVKDLALDADILTTVETVGRTEFEAQRRRGADVTNALELAESVMLKTLTPILDRASRLKDILASDFADQSYLASPPHLGNLLRQLTPILAQHEQWTRIAELTVVGIVAEYITQNQQTDGVQP